jgi:hypothetical protein
MTHQDLQKTIQIEASKSRKTTLFPNRVAKAWVGQLRSYANRRLELLNARPLEAGFGVGSSDLIGVTRVTITPEMVGRTVAVFTAVEVKVGKDRLSKEQIAFLALVKGWGGIAVECRETPAGLFDAVAGFVCKDSTTEKPDDSIP